ncbi:MAG: hypothetical protein AB7G28_02530 [Pirellulales bacterium]
MKYLSSSNSTTAHSFAILNSLFGMLNCSLARYLSYARPKVRRRYVLVDAVTRRLSREHDSFAAQIAQLIDTRRGIVRSCVFPMKFTHYNDLALEYLAPRLLEQQHLLIRSAEECASELSHDPEAQELVNLLLSSLRQYAALLLELLTQHGLVATHSEKDRSKSIEYIDVSPTSANRLRHHGMEPQSAA